MLAAWALRRTGCTVSQIGYRRTLDMHTCAGADNCATGAMLLHAQADPSSASPSYLASHFQNDILQYVTQPGHTTNGERHAAQPLPACRRHAVPRRALLHCMRASSATRSCLALRSRRLNRDPAQRAEPVVVGGVQRGCSGRRTRRPGSRSARRCPRHSPRCCTSTAAWPTRAPPRSSRRSPRRSWTMRLVRLAAPRTLHTKGHPALQSTLLTCTAASQKKDIVPPSCMSHLGETRGRAQAIKTSRLGLRSPALQTSDSTSDSPCRQQPNGRVVRGGLRRVQLGDCAAPPLCNGLPAGLLANQDVPRHLHQRRLPQRALPQPVPGAPAFTACYKTPCSTFSWRCHASCIGSKGSACYNACYYLSSARHAAASSSTSPASCRAQALLLPLRAVCLLHMQGPWHGALTACGH